MMVMMRMMVIIVSLQMEGGGECRRRRKKKPKEKWHSQTTAEVRKDIDKKKNKLASKQTNKPKWTDRQNLK